jgi:hypothetical protein
MPPIKPAGSTPGNRQVVPEATGGEDGGRLGDLAMEAEKASICSFFQVTFTKSPLSPYRRGRPHFSPTCPGCRQVCGFLCSSKCHQSSPKARAHRGASTGYPQHHQVGTTSGRTRWGQPSNLNDRKGRQERSKTGWCYLKHGSRNSWAKVSTSPDQDSGGGKATMGSDQYGVEVVHWPPLQGQEDAKDGYPPAGPRSSQDGALAWQLVYGCSTAWW